MSTKPFLPTPEALIKAKKNPDLVDVPARLVLALDGSGGPEHPGFALAIGALYGISYTLRFARKKAGLPVFKVGVLEGEWRAEGEGLSLEDVPSPDQWRWRLQMGVPEDMTEGELSAGVEVATTKRGGKLEGSEEAKRIRLLRLEPARFARILHMGPYATEPESFAKIGDFLATEGLKREPWHVEVYLSDPGRTAPAKLKTALLTKIR
jgi:hypothetical protein